MSVGQNGKNYEDKIHTIVKGAFSTINGASVTPSTAGFGSYGPDLELVLHGRKLGIEIKLDDKAQMGGGSYNFSYHRTIKGSKFFQSDRTHIEPEMEVKFQEMLESKKKPLRDLIDHAKNEEKPVVADRITGLPIQVRKEFWSTNIQGRGYLKQLNMKTTVPLDFMLNHYDAKGIQYIQIGKAGFFYLKSNPLNLPVPKLTSQLFVEFRLGPSGAKATNYKLGTKTLSYNTVTANYRVQGRLNGCSSSPYTFENPNHIKELFGNLTESFIEKKLK